MVYAGLKITEIAEHLCAARSSVERWINLFIQLGEIGLITRKPGRSKGYPEQLIQKMLRVLVESSPTGFWLVPFTMERGVTGTGIVGVIWNYLQ
ncbi:helix-turn-helix domain-containing protein [Salmonella enterica subsp. diarizonae]|nr:helix-turn-helix domain-containing protein [Salmonella enterica]ECC3884380.1 helix-turn-helix domain-containing protein [Salmonella enterica subsp. diarizonae]ECJ4782006.1 helix-turn-helix domain-containing protein [Salmonella enterica subsp. diarizonae]EDQ7409507.1 helix-turn-helix domain-containing protein [Salmonella enterica subsp. diarizonae]EKG3508638.1 helix-turn-helix domain-containing protein [Salmonella enterica]